jgi:hypothetical protein
MMVMSELFFPLEVFSYVNNEWWDSGYWIQKEHSLAFPHGFLFDFIAPRSHFEKCAKLIYG